MELGEIKTVTLSEYVLVKLGGLNICRHIHAK